MTSILIVDYGSATIRHALCSKDASGQWSADAVRDTSPAIAKTLDGKWKFGEAARRYQLLHPKRAIAHPKDYLGQSASYLREVSNYELEEHEDGVARICWDDCAYPLEYLVASSLSEIKGQSQLSMPGQRLTDVALIVSSWMPDRAKICACR